MKRSSSSVSFLASEFPPAVAGAAAWHVIPAGYERTVSYGGGTAAGPDAILAASQQLEAYLEGVGEPGERGIHTTPPVAFGDTADAALGTLRQSVEFAVACGAKPVLLGGEHTISHAAVAALVEHGERFGVVQFDAHADLRDTYGGTAWSHACVTRRMVEDFSLPVAQFGVRSLCREERAMRRKFKVVSHDASAIARHGVPHRPLPDDFPERIYLTFDVDAFDAALMPATGTPEPGGLDWWTTVELLARVCRQRTLIGFDVVELAPQPNLHHCNYTAAKLVYLLMGLSVSRTAETKFGLDREICG